MDITTFVWYDPTGSLQDRVRRGLQRAQARTGETPRTCRTADTATALAVDGCAVQPDPACPAGCVFFDMETAEPKIAK